jgi:hypothetical protein
VLKEIRVYGVPIVTASKLYKVKVCAIEKWLKNHDNIMAVDATQVLYRAPSEDPRQPHPMLGKRQALDANELSLKRWLAHGSGQVDMLEVRAKVAEIWPQWVDEESPYCKADNTFRKWCIRFVNEHSDRPRAPHRPIGQKTRKNDDIEDLAHIHSPPTTATAATAATAISSCYADDETNDIDAVDAVDAVDAADAADAADATADDSDATADDSDTTVDETYVVVGDVDVNASEVYEPVDQDTLRRIYTNTSENIDVRVGRNKPPRRLSTFSSSSRYGTSIRNESCTKCRRSSPCVTGERCENRAVNIECAPGRCHAGAFCQNQQIRRGLFSKVSVVRCPTYGYALRLDEDVLYGTKVIEYVGELITEEQKNTRMDQMLTANEQHFYFYQVQAGELHIDAFKRGNFSRFANHSCQPNCEFEMWFVDGVPRIILVALGALPAGTILSARYMTPEWLIDCLCGFCDGSYRINH